TKLNNNARRGPVLFTNGRDTQQSKILINGGLGGFVSLTAGFKDVMLEASKGEAEASGGGVSPSFFHNITINNQNGRF
ncbi:MAG TPA: hypothetical protein VLH15_11980, partial [Dehalococcoidales bacterium]|nr:hypothetical protein [Dehalococcoidales bacterium]